MKIEVNHISDALRAPNIIGGWLFGSAQNGEVQDGSDVDVGVFFAGKPGLDALVECRTRLQNALQFEDVDLVSLNGASPILRFEALCGRRIFCADEDRCAEFASLTAREYEDEMSMCDWLMK